MARLGRQFQRKVSILQDQRDRLQLNQACLEYALQRAKTSIYSPSNTQFLLSRPDIVSTLETKESYSLVLEPEAQFLPEFTKDYSKEEKRKKRVRMFCYVTLRYVLIYNLDFHLTFFTIKCIFNVQCTVNNVFSYFKLFDLCSRN